MDVARGNRKPASQIGLCFEHGGGCLLNSTGISCEGEEKRERARDPAEGSVGSPGRSGNQGCRAIQPGPGSGQVCCLSHALDL